MAYDKWRKNTFLILPSSRVLTDYRNAIHQKRGFNKEILEELKEPCGKLFDSQRYVALCFDEMKIQSGLVWDKVSGELIGHLDLGDPNLNYKSLN